MALQIKFIIFRHISDNMVPSTVCLLELTSTYMVMMRKINQFIISIVK